MDEAEEWVLAQLVGEPDEPFGHIEWGGMEQRRGIVKEWISNQITGAIDIERAACAAIARELGEERVARAIEQRGEPAVPLSGKQAGRASVAGTVEVARW